MKTKQVFVVDGVEYADYGLARQAEEKLNEEKLAVYDPTKDVESMRKCRKPRLSENSLLIFSEKHGDRYFIVSDTEHLDAACMIVLYERFTDHYGGSWYYDEAEIQAKYILDNNLTDAAFGFLETRDDCEYETFYIESAQKVKKFEKSA